MAKEGLKGLQQIIRERRESGDPKTSYIAKLFKKGGVRIAKKFIEEAGEVTIASIRLDEKPKSEKRRADLIAELADLEFHRLVLLAHHDISEEDIQEELRGREGLSGIEEKASRNEPT